MKQNKLTKLVDGVKNFAKTKDRQILTATTIAGVFITGVMAYRAGMKASKIIDEYHEDMSIVDPDDSETKKQVKIETAKKLAPVVIPPVISAVATTAAALSAHKVSSKKIALVSAAYTIAEKSASEWQEKATEILGEKGAQKIKEAIVEDDVKKDPPPANIDSSTVMNSGFGGTLCKDMFSGRYFLSSPGAVQKTINELSSTCMNDNYVSLNEFYDLLNIERTPLGDDFGWNVDDLDHGNLPIPLTSALTDDNRPVLCIGSIDECDKPHLEYRRIR